MWGLAAWFNSRPERKHRVAPGAARRAVRKYDHLRPDNDSPDAFDAWLADLGVSLPAEDALAFYLDICELAGWDATGRLTATAAMANLPVAPAAPASPPPSVAVAPAAVVPVKAAPSPKSKPPIKRTSSELVEVSPNIAARGFVDWCRVHGRSGTYNTDEMTAIEAEYFAAEGLVPVSRRPFRNALARVSGVTKSRPDNRSPDGQRPVSWQITAAETVSAELPWTDLKRRVA